MGTNIECFRFGKVEALENFKLLGMRHGETNAVTQRV